MSFLDALPDHYRLILCDLWGVVHDGVRLLPGAETRLRQWRGEGRTIVFLTNAPRTAAAVEQQLSHLGLDRETWDMIATSGETGVAELLKLPSPPGFLGTAVDRKVFEGCGLRFVEEGFADLACTGLDECRRNVEAYRAELALLAERQVRLHCLNPDRMVVRGGVPEPCAGALAVLYGELGGHSVFYGKPYRAIYDHALALVGNPPAAHVLAIGDGLQTDVLGAAQAGFDTVFVEGGIHAGEGFPEDFGARNGLGEWAPVAVVPSLA